MQLTPVCKLRVCNWTHREKIGTRLQTSPGRPVPDSVADSNSYRSDCDPTAGAIDRRTSIRQVEQRHCQLSRVIEDSKAIYLLSFAPDTQPDDKYHQLKVTVPARRDIKLRYRDRLISTARNRQLSRSVLRRFFGSHSMQAKLPSPPVALPQREEVPLHSILLLRTLDWCRRTIDGPARSTYSW